MTGWHLRWYWWPRCAVVHDGLGSRYRRAALDLTHSSTSLNLLMIHLVVDLLGRSRSSFLLHIHSASSYPGRSLWEAPFAAHVWIRLAGSSCCGGHCCRLGCNSTDVVVHVGLNSICWRVVHRLIYCVSLILTWLGREYW